MLTDWIELQQHPELDSHGNPIHYIARVAPGLHLGELCEVWMRYDYTGKSVGTRCVAIRFATGNLRIFDETVEAKFDSVNGMYITSW